MLATWAQSITAFLFLTICVLLCLLILIQKGKGGGLSGAFGGVGSYSPFGTKTGDALTWATVVLTGLYLLVAVLANYAYRPINLSSLGAAMTIPTGQEQPATPPSATATPETPTSQPAAAPAQKSAPAAEAAPKSATPTEAPSKSATPTAAAPKPAPAVPATQPSAGQ